MSVRRIAKKNVINTKQLLLLALWVQLFYQPTADSDREKADNDIVFAETKDLLVSLVF